MDLASPQSSSNEDEDQFENTQFKNALGTAKVRAGQKVNDTVLLMKKSNTDFGENVTVVVRVRPMSDNEIQKGCIDTLIVDQSKNSIEIKHPSTKNEKKFTFDYVFPLDTQQAELYNVIARPIVQNVIEGYNGTIFAYGQTGTGKTYTMEGDREIPELKGIIPNSFAQIFSHISGESGDSKFLVRVNYLEIYNEEVRDLLGKDLHKKLEIKEADGNVYVKGLSSFVVKTEKDMEKILGVGKKNRSVGSTNMNLESSRSHAIFTVTVECSTEIAGEHRLRMGKLNLVDLAGSERAGKSGATGIRLKEGAKINLSLSSLGNVISALVDGKPHIPYRSSKLTRLLQDSLGGNSKTVMIANIGPADYNYEETVSTLRYADRAKSIKNHARINEDPKDAILRGFENEIEALKQQLEFEDHKLRNMIGHPRIPEEGLLDGRIVEVAPPDEATLAGIKGEIETQEQLSTTVKTETEHKRSTLFHLKENVLNWKHHQEKKRKLQEKLLSIQKKIMVGGESLLDKSQEQEAYLQRCMKELEERRQEGLKLQVSLSHKIAEKVVSEERILRLQAKQNKIKMEMKNALRLLRSEELAGELAMEEQRAERQALEREIRRVSCEVAKDRLVINKYLPKKSLDVIESNANWDPNKRNWNIQYKDFSGNNLKQAVLYCQGPRNYTEKKDLSFAYKSIGKNSSRVDGSRTGRRCRRGQVECDKGRKKDYVSLEPIRTTKLITVEDSLKLVEDADIYEPPSFHFLNSQDSKEPHPLFPSRGKKASRKFKR